MVPAHRNIQTERGHSNFKNSTTHQDGPIQTMKGVVDPSKLTEVARSEYSLFLTPEHYCGSYLYLDIEQTSNLSPRRVTRIVWSKPIGLDRSDKETFIVRLYDVTRAD